MRSSQSFTLEQVCEILELDMPPEFYELASKEFPTITSLLSPLDRSSIHFSTWLGEDPRVRKTDLSKTDRIVFAREQQFDKHGTPVPTLIHPDPGALYPKVIRHVHPRKNGLTTVAITGSNGKTTTKQMIGTMTPALGKTFWVDGNANAFGKVGDHILALEPDHEVYVEETGAWFPEPLATQAWTGNVDACAFMLEPNIAVLLNIAFGHVGEYGGSQEALLLDKLNVERRLARNGAVIVNFDDVLLRNQAYSHEVISFGVKSTDADLQAIDIEENNGGINFHVLDNRSGTTTPIRLNVFGLYNVSNALAAFAVGLRLGLDRELVANSLSSFQTKGVRQNLVELAGQSVLVDTYNVTDASASESAKILGKMPIGNGGRRIYVLGAVPRLGARSEDVHRRLAHEIIEAGVDIVLALGDGAEYLVDELSLMGLKASFFPTQAKLRRALREELKPKDAVALKAASAVLLSRTVDLIYGTDYIFATPNRLRGNSFTDAGVRYRQIRGFGTVISGVTEQASVSDLELGGERDGSPVHMLAPNSFRNSKIQSVTLKPPIISIAARAFLNSKTLQKVTLPSSLRAINTRAFEGCSTLQEIAIPEGLTTIGRRAFWGCTSLKQITLPRSLRTIAPDAFGDCPELTIRYYSESSMAEALASDNRFSALRNIAQPIS